jgi:prevent-host-death family protein
MPERCVARKLAFAEVFTRKQAGAIEKLRGRNLFAPLQFDGMEAQIGCAAAGRTASQPLPACVWRYEGERDGHCRATCNHDTMTMVIKGPTMGAKKMAAGAFKANCLAVMDEVRDKRVSVLLTKRGKPVAKLVPVEPQDDEIIGFLRGKVTIVGDVVSPALSLEEWGNLA